MSDSLYSPSRSILLGILLAALTFLAAAPAVAGIGDARISGQVLDEEGKPVAGMLVRMVPDDPGEQDLSVTTNKKGRFVFPVVRPTAYRPLIEADGYLLQSVRASVRNSDSSVTKFEETEVRKNGSPTMSIGPASRISLELGVAVRVVVDSGSASLHGLENATDDLEVLNALFELGAWGELLERSETLLAGNPGDGGATYLRAIALWRTDALADARSHFLRALETIPEQPGLNGSFGAMLLDYGSRLSQQGDAEGAARIDSEAREQLEAQIRATPGVLVHLVNHVIACERLKDLDAAVSTLRELIEVEPQRVEFQSRLAELLIELERGDEALAVLESMSGDPAQRAVLIYNTCISYRNASRLEEAAAAIELAIGIQPDEGLYHRLKGRVLFQLNRTDEALIALRRAVELSPDDNDKEVATDRALIQALEK